MSHEAGKIADEQQAEAVDCLSEIMRYRHYFLGA